MPVFAYKGVTLAGKNVTGQVDAENPRTARADLRARGILASDLSQTGNAAKAAKAKTSLGARRVPVRALSRMVRQLATLIGAGIPLVEAVASVGNRPNTPQVTAALSQIRTDLTEGSSFEASVAKHPSVFPEIYVGMIRAGEATGALDAVLTRIADHAEATARLQGQVRSAMTYPIIMALVGMGTLTFLLAYVVPQVTRVFLEAGQSLPLPTRILMTAGDWAGSYGLQALLVLAIGALALRYYASTENGGRRVERFAFAVPWIGSVLKNVSMARLAQTLSTLMAGGMPLVESLGVARSVTGSRVIGDVVTDAADAVSQGGALAPNFAQSPYFNPMVVDMIAVGERSGELETMLAKAADALDEEVAANVETMTGVLEPIMILFMAGIVLTVVLAVLLPVFEMNQLVR